jgi:hypothetical protein
LKAQEHKRLAYWFSEDMRAATVVLIFYAKPKIIVDSSILSVCTVYEVSVAVLLLSHKMENHRSFPRGGNTTSAWLFPSK